MENLIKKSIFALGCLFLLMPLVVRADGMVIPPEDYYIHETDQKAVIFYDKGVETLVLSITFKGNANDFGWVIPAPSKPEVSKGSDDIFTNLQTLTGYTNVSPQPLGLGVGSKLDESTGVTVIETKKVDYYDVTVLTATDREALTNWLEGNNYNFPASASYILDSYIDNGWFFVAMKINPQSLEWKDVSQQLREGHATPVVLKFKTNNIVYPLKISSVVSQVKEDIEVPEFPTPILYETFGDDESVFVSGKIDKGAYIDTYKFPYFPAKDVYSNKEGTVSVWFNSESVTYIELVTFHDAETSEIFDFKIEKDFDSKFYNLLLVSRAGKNEQKIWTSQDVQIDFNKWQQAAVTWKEGGLPIFYLNGQKLNLSSGSWNNFSSNEASDGEMYIGKKYHRDIAVKMILDELAVYSKQKTSDEILADYQSVSNGTPLKVEGISTFLAHFDSSLKEEVTGKDMIYKSITDTNQKSTTKKVVYYSPPTSASILLYVIANNKKELTDFSTNYANWIDKKSIQKLAVDDQGNHLIQPSSKKYFLTKLTRTINYSDMTSDLFLQDAGNNETVGNPIKVSGTNSVTPFYILVLAGASITIILVIKIVLIGQKKSKVDRI